MPSFPNAWMAGSRGIGMPLPREDIEKALDYHCAIPPPTKDNVEARIRNSSFNHITELLSESGNNATYSLGSAERPRIFTVLRTIGRLDALPEFVKHDLYDLELPFEAARLPAGLGDSKPTFIRLQKHVLTHAREIESEHHVTFGGNADDHFITKRLLGQGGQGQVDEVLSRLSFKFYARKAIVRKDDSKGVAKEFKREMEALRRLRHRHLVRIMGSYTDRHTFGILMLPVADQNLLHFLERATEADFPALRSFFGCLASTLLYLHKAKIHHMDLKPRNILVKSGSIYVTDFGSAHDWSTEGRSTTQTCYPFTPRYAPPELLRNQSTRRNWATDMWSLGIVFLEMVTVLRMSGVHKMRAFLRLEGTKHEFVSQNLTAIYDFFDVLRNNTSGMPSDNEPLIWIKDLISDVPENRPTAYNLTQQILKSGIAWRKNCCAELNTRYYEIRSDAGTQDVSDDTIEFTKSVSLPQAPNEQAAVGAAISTVTRQKSDVGPAPGSSNGNVRRDDERDVHIEAQRPSSFLAEERDSTSAERPYDIVEDSTFDAAPLSSHPMARNISKRLQNFDFLDLPAPDPRSEKGELGDYPSDNDPDRSVYAVDYSSDDSDVTAKPNPEVGRVLAEFHDMTVATGESPSEKAFAEISSSKQDGSLSEPVPSGFSSPHVDLGSYGEIYENPWLSDDVSLLTPPSAQIRSNSASSAPATLSKPSERERSLSEFESENSTISRPNEVDGAQADCTTSEKDRDDTVVAVPPSMVHRTRSFVRLRPSANLKALEPPEYQPGVNYVLLKSQSNEEANKENDADSRPSRKLTIDEKKARIRKLTGANANTANANTANASAKASPLTLANLKALNKDNQNQTALTEDKLKTLGKEATEKPKSVQRRPKLAPLAMNIVRPQYELGERQRTPYSSTPKQPLMTRDQAKSGREATSAGTFRGAKRPPTWSAETYINEVYIEESEAATSIIPEAAEAKLRSKLSLTKYLDSSYDHLKHFAKDGNAPAVRILLEKGANPGTKDKPRPGPLLAAVSGGTSRHLRCARALLERNADPNVKRKGKPALHMAIDHAHYKGYVKLICELLQNGADPNVRDVAGNTALHTILLGGGCHGALPRHRRDALAMLIKHGADVEAVPRGTLQKPIHLAVRRADPWAVSMLLYGGASVNDRDSAGATPLTLAAADWTAAGGPVSNDQMQVLLHLLWAGAHVNEPATARSRPVLHAAIARHDDEVVRILTQDHGASPSLVDAEGKNAFRVLSDVMQSGGMDANCHKLILEALKEALVK